jgi:hypothetical protein
MILLLRQVQDEDVEGGEEDEGEAAEVEGEYLYRRVQYFLRVEKKRRRHRPKAQQPKELPFLLERVGAQEKVTIVRLKVAETQ